MTSRTGRDAGIDAVRAFAIVGVVGGHWLVTGLVLDGDGALRQASPLAAMPALAPATWVLQTLGLFFFAGGFAATRALDRRADDGKPAAPTARVLARPVLVLARPVLMLLGFWAVVLAAGAAAGTPDRTLRTVAVLVVSPLWFLLPYLALRAANRPLLRLIERAGGAAVAAAVLVVAASDAGLVPGWPAVAAAWAVPWMLGMMLARHPRAGELRVRRAPHLHRHAGAALAVTGAAGMALLVGLAGYPASAVGVPGDGRSNMSPPSLFAVALAVAQIGIVLIIRARVGSGCGARGAGVVGRLNRVALPVYLAHQSVLLVVTAAAGLVHPRLPGLLTAPESPAWVAHRLAWLPLLAAALALVVALRTPRPDGARHAGATRAH